jgi:hypothetical protein
VPWHRPQGGAEHGAPSPLLIIRHSAGLWRGDFVLWEDPPRKANPDDRPGGRDFVVTTDSGHNGPIFPDLARDRIVDGPNQLWVADITYIAIATGAESFMKTLKVEAVYLMDYETFEDVTADLPHFIDKVTTPADSTPRSAT